MRVCGKCAFPECVLFTHHTVGHLEVAISCDRDTFVESSQYGDQHAHVLGFVSKVRTLKLFLCQVRELFHFKRVREISTTLFVSLMNTINFSSLRLDNFIQLLDTSSVTIGLEFVL